MGDEKKEWTERIQNWIEEVQDEFRLYKFVGYRFKDKPTDVSYLDEVPFIKKLHMDTFPNYLRKTDRIETFVLTHHDAYSFGIIDMIARGIRVLVPRGALEQNDFVERFNLPQFETKEEFLSLLKTPYSREEWETKICHATDYSSIIGRIIHRDFVDRQNGLMIED
jgi:hypothetical protein